MERGFGWAVDGVWMSTNTIGGFCLICFLLSLFFRSVCLFVFLVGWLAFFYGHHPSPRKRKLQNENESDQENESFKGPAGPRD